MKGIASKPEYLIGLLVGTIVGIVLSSIVSLSIGHHQGAIAAHKGEIVCVQLVFKEERWECGEL